ncbi:MAG: M28 family peptidase [Bacteroidota bacterium]
MKKLWFCLFYLPILGIAQNAAPQITNLQAAFNPATNRLTASFDISDAENDSVEVILLVSDNAGIQYTLDASNAFGDVGFPIAAETGRLLYWDAPQGLNADSLRIKVVVDDRMPADIGALVAQVDSNRLRSDLNFIAQIRHRIAGLPHLEAVKDTIETLFVEFNLATRRQGKDQNGYAIENILGRRTGVQEPDIYYILDAHFDGVSVSPGADDNGSGVVGVLEAARIMSAYEFDKTIEFVGFDQEELGLLGSLAYVLEGGVDSAETLAGVFNLEMIGYYDNAPNTQQFPNGFNLLFPAQYNAVAADGFRGNFLTNVANANSTPLMQAYDNAAQTYVPELKVISLAAPGNAELAPDLRRSDHAPFWEAGYQALMLTDASEFRNFNYHSPNDTVGSLNFTFMSRVVQASIATLAELAGLKHASSATASVANIPVSISELACDFPLIYVQPDAFHLDFSGLDCTWRQADVQFINMQGQIVQQQAIPRQTDRLRLNTSTLSKGIYLVKIKIDTEIYWRKVSLF